MADFTGPYGAFNTEDIWRLAQMAFGEARGEGDKGITAVMQVAANRMKDDRYPNTARGVVLEPKQFTAWDVPHLRREMDTFHNRRPEDFEKYVKTAHDVLSGTAENPLAGTPAENATNYYSPGGMKSINGGRPPSWWTSKVNEAGGFHKLGNHMFAGTVQGASPAGSGESRGRGPAAVSAAAKGAAPQRPDIKTPEEIDKEFGDDPRIAEQMKIEAAKAAQARPSLVSQAVGGRRPFSTTSPRDVAPGVTGSRPAIPSSVLGKLEQVAKKIGGSNIEQRAAEQDPFSDKRLPPTDDARQSLSGKPIEQQAAESNPFGDRRPRPPLEQEEAERSAFADRQIPPEWNSSSILLEDADAPARGSREAASPAAASLGAGAANYGPPQASSILMDDPNFLARLANELPGGWT